MLDDRGLCRDTQQIPIRVRKLSGLATAAAVATHQDLGDGGRRAHFCISRVKIRLIRLRFDGAIDVDDGRLSVVQAFRKGPEELPRMPPFVRLPLGVRQMSVCDDDIRRRLGGLHAVRSPLVVVHLLHLDLSLGTELRFLFVPESTERRRRARFRMRRINAMVRRALVRRVRCSREETLARLAGAVAHLRLLRSFVVERRTVMVQRMMVAVRVAVRRVLASDQDRQQLTARYVAGRRVRQRVRAESVGFRRVRAVRT